jgi:hypothetical protein
LRTKEREPCRAEKRGHDADLHQRELQHSVSV